MPHRLQDFVLLLIAINPALVVPEFVLVTEQYTAAAKARIALEAVLIAGAVLLAFTALGQIVLTALAIELNAFQAAAGLILLLMGLRLVLEDRTSYEAIGRHPAVHPIAIPYIAGPKAILTVLLLTDVDIHTTEHDLEIGGQVVLVLLLMLVCLLAADWVHRVLHPIGVRIISRVMGLLLAALATQYILDALKQAFHVPP